MIPLWSKKQNFTNLSEEDLISKYIATQSKECFGEIYKRYSPMVYGACLKYLKNKDESYDATMDVFESLMKKLPEQNEIRSFNVWMYHVTKNECFSRLRASKKITIEPLDENFSEKNSDHFMENEGFLTLINEQDRENNEEAVVNALERLKPEQKACIKAFYLDKLSYKQIEEQLGFPLVKVKSYIQNGKRNLKVILQETRNKS